MSGFFGDLFGGKSAIKTSNDAAASTANYVNAGYDKANAATNDAYTAATGRINPYAQQGQQANTMYNDAIGVNGTGGYQKAFANFNADPFRQGENDYTNLLTRNMFRRYNGQGMGNSGASGAAVARVGAERYGQQVADYRNRLQGAGQMGWNAAQYGANLDTQRGSELGNQAIGKAGALANTETNRLMGIQQAKDNANKNIMTAVGGAANLLMRGFTPGMGGTTPFGNMAAAFGGGGGMGGVNPQTGYANSLPWAPQNQYGYGG